MLLTTSFWALGCVAISTYATPIAGNDRSTQLSKRWFPISPKVMIISYIKFTRHVPQADIVCSLFSLEDVWSEPFQLTENITVPGLSQEYPAVKCNLEGSVCQFTTGEAEINAAVSTTALLLSSDFNFTQTYFFTAGVAGVNPYMGTLGGVGLAQWAIQAGLAYEVDARQKPDNWSTGYWLQGSSAPGQYALQVYGSEVFELNTNLRDIIKGYTNGVQLNDSSDAAAYRALYDYAPANQPPAVFYGDVVTADQFYAGSLLAETFGNITSIWTNGTGHYALSAQEDNAVFEAMVRMDKAGYMDFSRVVLMRTCSDFDREPANQTAVESFQANQGGFPVAAANILIAGTPIIQGILNDWDDIFVDGVAPQANWTFNADALHTLTELKKRTTISL